MATQEECAQWLDVSRRTFNEYLSRGVVTRAPKGEYDVATVVQEYVAHLQQQIAAKEASTEPAAPLDKAAEDARRAKAQADKLELEIAAMRRRLVPVEQIPEGINFVVETIRKRLLAIPGKAAPLVGARSIKAAKAVIADAVGEAIAELDRILTVCADRGWNRT